MGRRVADTLRGLRDSNFVVGEQSLASGPTDKAMKELNTVCNANDENGLKSLMMNSQAFVLNANTRISIIDRHIATSDIIVQSGTYKGVRMRISNEYFNCK